MSEMQALIEKPYRCVNAGDFDGAATVFEPEVVTQHPGVPVMHLIAAFRGINAGPLQGPGGLMPATGRAFTLEFCDVFGVRDGKVTTHSVYYDN
jgi:ketosteroid isomerase-like protein